MTDKGEVEMVAAEGAVSGTVELPRPRRVVRGGYRASAVDAYLAQGDGLIAELKEIIRINAEALKGCEAESAVRADRLVASGVMVQQLETEKAERDATISTQAGVIRQQANQLQELRDGR